MMTRSWTCLTVALVLVCTSGAGAEDKPTELPGVTWKSTPGHVATEKPAPEAIPAPEEKEAKPKGNGVVSSWQPSCGRCGGGHRFWSWLTYRPLVYPGSYCCGKTSNPWGFPPLYIFFLCDGHGNGGCNGSCLGDVTYRSGVAGANHHAPSP
jgi:hypothetical protein